MRTIERLLFSNKLIRFIILTYFKRLAFWLWPFVLYSHDPQWILNNKYRWLIEEHPRLAFDIYPHRVAYGNFMWALENEFEWLKRNYPMSVADHEKYGDGCLGI